MSRALRALADRAGILAEYVDAEGTTRRTSDATRRAILEVMGMDAPTESAARGWLDQLDADDRERMLDPVRVVERDASESRIVRVRPPEGVRSARARVTLREEHGREWSVTRAVRSSGSGAVLKLPTRVGYGYHSLTVELSSGGREWSTEQSFVVAPSRCITLDERLGRRKRAFGVTANLYGVRREEDWGIGDSETLAQLVDWSASRRAAFVGINPLHALTNRGGDFGPYSPVSRLFRNPIYLDVGAVAALVPSDAARALLDAPDLRNRVAALRAEPLVDYDGVIDVKERVLRELHAAFRAQPEDSPRRRAYADFVKRHDPELSLFATWMALASASRVADWRRWPAAMHDPLSAAVRVFADANETDVDFHRWTQFELDAQLGSVAALARVRGMRVGIYQDLATGTSPGGSDSWTHPELFVRGASIGAPPDPYSVVGQNWGLPPLDPRAMARDRMRHWIRLVRHNLEHAGALRIDHVMGLFRSYWIPEGATGKDGAYVRMPWREMLGVLALESTRSDALIVGEDLGTVPPEVPRAMRRWGILSTKVLYFEQDTRGFRRASSYPAESLASANTHDLPPIAGYLAAGDVERRAAADSYGSARATQAARRARTRELESLRRLLRLPEDATVREVIAAVHSFLGATRARLIALALDDLMEETLPVNVPGFGPDQYPSWRRKTRMTVEALAASPTVDDLARIPL